MKKSFLLLAICLASLPAQAQIDSAIPISQDPVQTPSTFAEPGQGSTTSDSPGNFLEWDYFTGDWGGLRTTLSDHGLDFDLQSFSEVWGNTTGGIEQGAVYTGLMQLAATLDFEKLIGWEGASFYTRWLWLYGRDASEDLVGNIFTISNIAGFNTFRNIELWFQQELWDDLLSVRVGQLAADSEFVISDYGSLFLNGTFGWPAFIYTSIPNGGPGYPMGAPGVRVAVKPIEEFTFRAAVFQGDVFPQDVNRHGFRWRLNSAQGFLWLSEAEYRANQREDSTGLPGTYKVGAWFDSASSFPDASGSDTTHWGNYGLYFIVDQMLYREMVEEPAPLAKGGKNVAGGKQAKQPVRMVEKATDQGLGSFARFAFEPTDRNQISFYFDTGLTYKGLIPTRDDDTIGFALAYGQLTNGAKSQLASQGEVNPNYEMALEFTYQAQITPWLVVQPDLQYIIHPGGAQTLGNAFVVGGRAVVTF